MSGKLLLATFVAVGLLAVLLVTGCRGGLSPTEALAASRESFAEIESFQARFHFKIDANEVSATTDGQAAYQSDDLAYSRHVFAGDAPGQEEIAELLFLPPDLYLRMSDGRWFVLSPWNQGIRPDEQPQFGPDTPIVDYDQITGHLSDIEQLPDETIDGEDYLRYAGVIDLREIPSSAPPDVVSARPSGNAQGTANVELWLHKESYLPHKMQISASLARGESSLLTFEFFDYNRPIALPQRPADARPYRDLQFPEAPCTGSEFAECLDPQTALQPMSSASCEGAGRRICLVPLGQVSPALVMHLVEHYRDQYGLAVTVLTPAAVPADLADSLREQVDAATLIEYMGSLFPEAYADRQAVLIGLMAVDLYDRTSHFRYLFGLKGTVDDPKGVVSFFRMPPEFYGETPDEDLFFSRARKLLSKYVGLLYYGLPPSDDPRSPMFDSILGPDDLDRMGEPLPVAGQQ
jgi:archaemetzincin